MNIAKIHSEYAIDSFTKHDGTILFFNFVRALIAKAGTKPKVLDFGAGRGSFHYSKSSTYSAKLHNLQSAGAEVWAADVDAIVETHPCSDHQVVLKIGEPLPFDDNTFDIIVSDFVFEHIDNPKEIANELIRITKPGGWICARTPNKWGYVTFASRLIPNVLHAKLLKKIQPSRKEEDIFPTVYRLNSPKDIRRNFPKCKTSWFYTNGDPSYHFNCGFMYRLLLILHRVLPTKLSTCACFFIHKT